MSTFVAAPVMMAYGTKTKAPIKVLAKTMVGVEKLSRAIAIKKYGSPQKTPVSRNSINPRRDTCIAYWINT